MIASGNVDVCPSASKHSYGVQHSASRGVDYDPTVKFGIESALQQMREVATVVILFPNDCTNA